MNEREFFPIVATFSYCDFRASFHRNWEDTKHKGRNHGRPKRVVGGLANLDFEIWHFPVTLLAKKDLFIASRGKKWSFTIFDPPGKILGHP